jgi:hypothetical protein
MNDLAYDITDKDVQWMRDKYRARFGLEINAETARRELYRLVRQVELVYRPITKQQAKEVNENDSNQSASIS